jgi:hypothetical protein
MKYLLRAIAELLVFAAILFVLLLLAVSQLPDPSEKRGPPSPQDIRLFMRDCPDRTVLIHNKLECRK